MFDIGFSELLVIGVVALIVIGPERLPKVARTAGHLLGRLQRYVNDVKADINREMELDELRKLKTQVQDAARSIEESVSHASRDFEAAVHGAETELHRISAGAGEPTPSSGEASAATGPTPPPAPLGELPAHSATAPASSGATAPAASVPPRQGSLPGFDQG